MKKSLTIALFLITLICSPVVKAAITATFSLDETKLGVNDSTTLSFTISGGASVGSFDLPVIPGLNVARAGSSRNIQILNGNRQAVVVYMFKVLAQKAGSYTIGPYKITAGDETLTSNAVTLEVSASSPVTNNPNIILRQRTQQKTYYVGEPVVLITELLYRARNIRGVQALRRDTKGITIGETRQGQQNQEVIDGQTFEVATWYQVVSSTSVGTLQIPEVYLTLSMAMASRRQDIFSSTFGRTKNIHISGEPISVPILDLPQEGKPKGFKKRVGRYTLVAEVGTKEVSQGEGVTLTYSLQGKGDIPYVELPTIVLPDGVKAYEPEIKREITSGRLIEGVISSSQLLVMEKEGDSKIGPLEFTYFDTVQKRYVRIDVGPFMVKVLPAKQVAISTAAATQGSKVRLLNTDLLPLKNIRPQSKTSNGWIVMVYIGSFLSYSIFLVLQRHKNKTALDDGYARRKGSSKAMKLRLQKSKELLKGDSASFCRSLSEVIPHFIADKLNVPPASCVGPDLRTLLQKSGASTEFLDSLSVVQADLDTIRFSGGEIEAGKRNALLHECEALMLRTEKELSL